MFVIVIIWGGFLIVLLNNYLQKASLTLNQFIHKYPLVASIIDIFK